MKNRYHNRQNKLFNFESVNVCTKCRRTHLHYDAVKAGYNKCPECLYQESLAH